MVPTTGMDKVHIAIFPYLFPPCASSLESNSFPFTIKIPGQIQLSVLPGLHLSRDPCTAPPARAAAGPSGAGKHPLVTRGGGKFKKAGGAAGIFRTCACLPAGAERPRAMKLLPLHLEDFLDCRRRNSFLRKHLLPYNIGIEQQKKGNSSPQIVSL